jgi:hypothetical protein
MREAVERRRHARVRLDGRLVGRATVLTDFRVAALSEGGATLEMGMPLALGSACDLSLELTSVALDVRARVVEVLVPQREGEPYRVGVAFVGVDPIDLGLLRSFLERERRRQA